MAFEFWQVEILKSLKHYKFLRILKKIFLTGPYPRSKSSLALWKKYNPKSKRLPDIREPLTNTFFSSRCHPLGRT